MTTSFRKSPLRIPSLLGLLSLTLGSLGCSAEDAPEAASPRPDVVMIVVDTLRADRLAFYGCDRENAPFLSSLAAKGLVYEQGQAPGPWTVPSTASLMTSTYPFQHGVVDGFNWEASDEENADETVNRIPSAVETLPEMMRDFGYKTYGVSANVLVGVEMGFDRGFDRFSALDDEIAETVNATIFEWKEELLGNEQPNFLYLHYFDPHDPYYVREPWFDLDALEAPDATSASAFARLRAGAWDELDDEMREDLLDYLPRMLGFEDESEVPEEALANPLDYVLACYDSEIRYLDEHIEKLFEELQLDDETMVILTADHGEEFLDHGQWEHGQSLFSELVHVPLMIKFPGTDAPRGRVKEPVSTMDVMPTLRHYLGGEASPQERGLRLHEQGDPSRVVLTTSVDLPNPDDDRQEEGSLVVGVLRGDWKAIVGTERDRRESEEVEQLFHLTEDPSEHNERAASDPGVLDALRAEWERIHSATMIYEREFGPVVIDEAMRNHMEGLGYTD